MLRTKVFLALCIASLLSACQSPITKEPANDKLWYLQPADASVPDVTEAWKDDSAWLQALPLGNGALGAMVFGDVNKERIQLNEESMWSGSPAENDNPAAFPAQAKIRELLFAGDYEAAVELTKSTQICEGAGSGRGRGANVPFGCFQTLGDLWLDFDTQASYENYYRELDLSEAVARVSYTQAGIDYQRSVFVSQPDQVLVIHLTASQAGKISFTSSLSRPERFKTFTQNEQLIMQGTLNDGKDGEGLQYMTRLSAIAQNGTISYTDSSLIVKNADEVTLLLTASTDYLLGAPNYKGRPYQQLTADNLQQAKQKSFEELLQRHQEEYQQYYKRVDFKLTTAPDTIPTDIRLQNFKKSDPYLVEKLFQYGRYLLIAASRPGTLPANLQGIWANKIQTPWNGDYHTDVNVQMNYWPAETTNLGELHLPLIDLMESLQAPGRKTAKIHYQADGWVVHPITNVWGFTAPGEAASWGMHVGAGAWLATHIMEHYYFTLDKVFLADALPILKGATQFYLDWLIPDPKTGELISGPSVSPENTFIAPDGSKSQICMGPAHDQQVIWQLFKNYIDAVKVLGMEDQFLQKVIKAQAKLAPPKIAPDGRLMEWNEVFEEVEPGHRHISHLFALHPGYQIDITRTPDLAEAAKKSLDYRIENGGGHTGWSAAWLINQYARLGEAEKAAQSLGTVLQKSMAPNLFGLHPPYQIDANFGATAGIAEMLLQSQAEDIRLLPALPESWAGGKVSGLCARAGFVIDLDWTEGTLKQVKVYSKNGGACTLSYQGKTASLETVEGKNYTLELGDFQ